VIEEATITVALAAVQFAFNTEMRGFLKPARRWKCFGGAPPAWGTRDVQLGKLTVDCKYRI